MFVFLIGMPGSGKSFALHQLSESENDFVCLDMDEIVEQQAGKRIKDIIDAEGEMAFRMLEHQVLQKIIAENFNRNTIVATGGGTPCFYDNLQLMKNSGTVIYLQVSIEILHKRLLSDVSRPLLFSNTKKELIRNLNEVFAVRQEIYEQADVILQCDNTKECNFTDKIKSFINR